MLQKWCLNYSSYRATIKAQWLPPGKIYGKSTRIPKPQERTFWGIPLQTSDADLIDLWEATLPETNIAPENGWLEYKFPFGMAYFQGLCSFQGGYRLLPSISLNHSSACASSDTAALWGHIVWWIQEQPTNCKNVLYLWACWSRSPKFSKGQLAGREQHFPTHRPAVLNNSFRVTSWVKSHDQFEWESRG